MTSPTANPYESPSGAESESPPAPRLRWLSRVQAAAGAIAVGMILIQWLSDRYWIPAAVAKIGIADWLLSSLPPASERQRATLGMVSCSVPFVFDVVLLVGSLLTIPYAAVCRRPRNAVYALLLGGTACLGLWYTMYIFVMWFVD